MWCLHSTEFYSASKSHEILTHYNMDEPSKHVLRKEREAEEHIFYDCIYMQWQESELHRDEMSLTIHKEEQGHSK